MTFFLPYNTKPDISKNIYSAILHKMKAYVEWDYGDNDVHKRCV